MSLKINYERLINNFILSEDKIIAKYPPSKYGKAKTLFVEGSIDKKVCDAIRKATETSSGKYYYYPIFTYKEFNAFMTSGPCGKMGKPYYAYQFVIDAAKTVKNSYGIIDNDLDQHKHEEPQKNLGITHTHDQETLLLLCYFNLYYKYLVGNISTKDRVALEDDLLKVLLFAVKQGLLEDTSISMSGTITENEALLLQLISHSYFKKGCEDIETVHGKKKPKVVEQYYLSNFEIEVDNSIHTFCSTGPDNALAQKFKRKFEKNLAKKESFLNNITVELIHLWLENGYDSLSSNQQQVINEICWYANGHIIISQLNDCIYRYIDVNKPLNEAFADGLVHYLANNYDVYCAYNPFKKIGIVL